ncbi:MAG: MFS transporter, partial [Novosphingobium sp.]
MAAYVAGTCAGLIGFGALADRIATRRLFACSLAATALLSLACSVAPSIEVLIVLRAAQGAIAAGPAVFAPAIVKAMFDEERAVRAMGLLGSIEALAPALAPIAGAALLTLGGWRVSFEVLAAAAALLALLVVLIGRLPQISQRPRGTYLALL